MYYRRYFCILLHCQIFDKVKQNISNAMKNQELKQKREAAYYEARRFCEMYVNYKGDKRRRKYKQLQRDCLNLWIGRMNNFGRLLGLPVYQNLFD